jgi:SH3 domain-containing YSC84-like protein 1
MSRARVLASRNVHLSANISLSLLVSVFLVASVLPVRAGDKAKDEETLKNAAGVLQAMLTDKNIPPDVIAKADCVIVLPNVKKFGIGIGGGGGRGPMVCRMGDTFNGRWSAPAMYTVGGISAGLQIGGSSSDYVLLVMDEKAADAILNGKTKMGRDATAAAGPSGATAGAVSGSDILTYGRAKGLFAGVSLGGASLEPDHDANKRLYGRAITAKAIVRGGAVQAPAGGEPLVSLLDSQAAKPSN